MTEPPPPQCPTRTRLHRAGSVADEGFPAEQISERLATDPDVAVWLDLHNPTEADLRIGVDEFGLHPLAVEDSIHPHQRPKVDRYRSHLFANMYAVAVSEESVLTTGEISVFITPRALIRAARRGGRRPLPGRPAARRRDRGSAGLPVPAAATSAAGATN